MRRLMVLVMLATSLAGGCGGDSDDGPAGDAVFPDVVAAIAARSTDGTWEISATISSPYDSPDRYADAWRVVAPDGSVLGVRELTHDHAGEQPFTRSLSGIAIDDSIGEVTIQGRDQVNGWGGDVVVVILER